MAQNSENGLENNKKFGDLGVKAPVTSPKSLTTYHNKLPLVGENVTSWPPRNILRA